MKSSKEYLRLCEACSKLPNGVKKIKQHVPERLLLVYDGTVYYPVARIVWYDDNGELHVTCRLHDLLSSSTIEVPLEKVERFRTCE